MFNRLDMSYCWAQMLVLYVNSELPHIVTSHTHSMAGANELPDAFVTAIGELEGTVLPTIFVQTGKWSAKLLQGMWWHLDELSLHQHYFPTR